MSNRNNAALQALLSRLSEINECPINHTLMANPSIVDAPCHHTVCSETATEWYRVGQLTCPVCGVRANSPNLTPNVQAREVVEEIRRIRRQDGHEEQSTQAPVAQPKRFSDGGVWGTYLGEVDANGLRHGEGKMTWDNGKVYEGEWQNDKLHGQGTVTYPDGAKYAGGYQNNMHHGHGIYQWADGVAWDDGCVYEGEWQNDKRHGQGTMAFPSGAKYAGGYQNGMEHGHGTFQWANGASYEGEYKDGKKDGQGTHKWPNGDKYVGNYKAGKMSGVGAYYFNSGRVDISQWKEDKRSGVGVCWSADRQTAWLLNDGKPGRKIDLPAAMAIASRLGFSEVP